LTARLTLLLVGALAIAALVAGCGGGNDSSSSTTVATSSLSKAQFVKKANAICEQGRTKFVNYLSKEVALPEAIVDVVAPTLEEVTSEIRELGAPKGGESQVEAFLASMQRGTEEMVAKRETAKVLSDIEPPFEESAKLAAKYGLDHCTYAFPG
jgi:hypothetical protein